MGVEAGAENPAAQHGTRGTAIGGKEAIGDRTARDDLVRVAGNQDGAPAGGRSCQNPGVDAILPRLIGVRSIAARGDVDRVNGQVARVVSEDAGLIRRARVVGDAHERRRAAVQRVGTGLGARR